MSFSLQEFKVHHEDHKKEDLGEIAVQISEEEDDDKNHHHQPHPPALHPQHPLFHHPKHPHRHIHHTSPKIYNYDTPESPRGSRTKWSFGCFYLDKECIVYFTQMMVLFSCIAVSLWKVATTTENRDIWVSLLSSCIGIVVPNPKLKNDKGEKE